MRLLGPLARRPGIFVTLLVMLLLKGVRGTATTVVDQTIAFAESFLGGGSGHITDVLWQTAPLALSVAVIVFAILRKWLPLDTGGVFIAALVILCGAWLGNELRYGGRMIEPLVENHQVGGWIGTMFNAANQLGGYLKDYEVNLFFASLAVGGYLGWRGHRLLQRVDDARKVPENSPTLKVPRERRKQDKRQAA